MTLGLLAKEYGIGRETVRFYERNGLMPRPKRNGSGYRIYDDFAAKTLAFIINAKEIGFTLSEIKELLSLRIAKASNCASVKAKARKKLAEADAKIAYLQKLKASLKSLIQSCDSNSTTSACPLIENLEA